jgi:hypothetical protein
MNLGASLVRLGQLGIEEDLAFSPPHWFGEDHHPLRFVGTFEPKVDLLPYRERILCTSCLVKGEKVVVF